ncbi:amino acid ABC transporter permease [Desulfopila inferna]|uniref:amino acid ABC transporter permease n=1 Tax=Desulfopila inferna TaxID=468528 RepID=UPI0019638A2F|nr:amino acid ABC transporter permease [Desulfopila inferna]MBM9604870.1 amino acid ABC transporter permease [Desulfopila inferna]
MDPFYTQELIPALNRGLVMSTMLIVPSVLFGLIGGVIVGTVRVYGPPAAQRLLNGYTSVFRGVPLMVQLFILYYGLPNIGIYFEAYTAAVVGFILCSSAYHSEYIRGALLSIKSGQMRAASALGMSKIQALVWIIIPQAFRNALPGCGNEIIYLIKYSSLAYIVSCIELTGEARAVAAQTFRFTESFMVVACYYLFLVTVATYLLEKFEKRLAIPGFGMKSR